MATDYADYKSDMLIATTDGGWQYVRVKNELARGNSIRSAEAKDLAFRSLAIAERLGRACHIMWFVGCVGREGDEFNLPWYWTEAHKADRNVDRINYRTFVVSNRTDLAEFEASDVEKGRKAIELRPSDLALMRDSAFIDLVAKAASERGIPVILSGSTLAHAYYQLRKADCTIITPGEKEYVRQRKTANFGKLVRDKIPDRISSRFEIQLSKEVSGGVRRGYLISKFIEECLEFREAKSSVAKIEELSDLFEVFRALAKHEGVNLELIRSTAASKREKSGGFNAGRILIETGIPPDEDALLREPERHLSEVTAGQADEDTAEVPFSFFGFMELDRVQSVSFPKYGIRLEITLLSDRLTIRLAEEPKQLDLPFLS